MSILDDAFSERGGIVRNVAVALAFVAIALAGAWMRVPILDDVICDPDVAGAAYSAQFFFEPGSVYANAVETKPPLTYLLFEIIFRLFGRSMYPVWIFAIFYHAACSLLAFLIVRRLAGVAGGVAAAFLYATYSTITTGNGLCANFETWTILPTLLALYLLIGAFTRPIQKRAHLFFAGAFVSVAAMFKQQAAMYVIAFGIAVIAESLFAPRSRKTAPMPVAVALYIAGGLVAALPVALYFASKGGLDDLVRALNPANYLGYASTEGWGFLTIQLQDSLWPFFRNVQTLLFLVYLALIPLPLPPGEMAEDLRRGRFLIPAYTLATLFAVFAGTKFFDHYFILLVPMLVILASRFVGRVAMTDEVRPVLKALVLFMLVPIAGQDLHLETSSATQATANVVSTGRANWTESADFSWEETKAPRFSTFSKRAKKLGECLSQNAAPGDTIFVWDYAPHVYFYSGLRAPTRHFMYFDVAVDLPLGSGRWHAAESARVRENRDELMRDLENAKPLYFVTFEPPDPRKIWLHITDPAPLFDDLDRFRAANYAHDAECADRYFVVWKRAGSAGVSPASIATRRERRRLACFEKEA
ncbi:glycosyltransferase family 39 protein [bacterium]|nr:glycosyltransferase family 39 protein [bacterium]